MTNKNNPQALLLICRHHLFEMALEFLDVFLQRYPARVVLVRVLLPKLIYLLLEFSFPLQPLLRKLRLLQLPPLLEEVLENVRTIRY